MTTLRLHLAGSWYATLISAYAPTLVSAEALKSSFYEIFRDLLQSLPILIHILCEHYRYCTKNTILRVKYDNRNIMIAGCLSSCYVGPLHIIQGTLDNECYV